MDADMVDIEDPIALVRYLRGRRALTATATPTMRRLSGGVSNKAILLERADGVAWVIKQALPRLRVATEWYSDPARIHREALGLCTLQRLLPPGSVAQFVFEDAAQHILAMTAVPQPHANWKDLLLAGTVETAHVTQFGRLLGLLHMRAAAQATILAPRFADRTFFESLRIEPYYRFVAEQLPATADFFNDLIAETAATRVTLVHGDYSPKNILVHREHLVLLDHEVIHWGDPAFDVGFALTHLLSKAHHLPQARPALLAAAAQVWATYVAEVAGAPWLAGLEERAVRHTLACLLARVAGRSPLEYLAPAERERQQQIALAASVAPPRTIPALIHYFAEEFATHATH